MHLVLLLVLLAATTATAQDLPNLSRDDDGNLHITTRPGSTLYVNGIAVNTTALDKQAQLEARLARLEAAITTTEDGVTIVGGSKGAFLSRGKQFVVKEGDAAWEPRSLTVQVGDTVTWEWYGLDSVYEVTSESSATPKAGGFDSGEQSRGGAFPVRFTFPGTYYMRSASKGYVTKISCGGVGNGGGVERRYVGSCTFTPGGAGKVYCRSSSGGASCANADSGISTIQNRLVASSETLLAGCPCSYGVFADATYFPDSGGSGWTTWLVRCFA